jgi:hypothetical protein
MSYKLVQFWKNPDGIFVMLLGITIWFNKMQPLNKFALFCTTLGIEFNIVCTLSSRRYVPENAASPMDVIVVISSKIISSNFEEFCKAPLPIEVIFAGIVKLVKPVFSSAEFPIETTLFVYVMEVNLEQLLNIPLGIEVMALGKVALVKLEQFAYIKSPIVVIVFGIVTFVNPVLLKA